MQLDKEFYKEGEYMNDGKMDILDFISDNNIDTCQLIKILFDTYETRKEDDTLYSKSDYIPQNLIKIYYKLTTHSSFLDILGNFKKHYICNENEIEGVRNNYEKEGLEVVYDYIQSERWQNCKNIYLINVLHSLLYSKFPYAMAGGTYRNSHTMISNSDVISSDPKNISKEIAELYKDFDGLINFAKNINENKDTEQLMNYIDDCVELKVKLIKIHPFVDGNGRTCRALLNLLFKMVNLPPTYVKKKEKDEYISAMDKAVRLNDNTSIKRFYYYKICDSIVELDINDKLKNNQLEQKKAK